MYEFHERAAERKKDNTSVDIKFLLIITSKLPYAYESRDSNLKVPISRHRYLPNTTKHSVQNVATW